MQHLKRTNFPNQCISAADDFDDVFLTQCNNASTWDTNEFSRTGRLTTGDGRCAMTTGLGFGDQLRMVPCSDSIAQKFYLSRDGNLRAAETQNSRHPGKKVFDDGCVGKDLYGTLITDRSGFGRNYRKGNSAEMSDNSRTCESRFAFAKDPIVREIIPCDPTIRCVDLSNECNYRTGQWITNDGYPQRESYAPPGNIPTSWPIKNCPVANHPTKKCIEVVSGNTMQPQQKIVCKTNYHGKNCDLYLADDTVTTPIPWNSSTSKELIVQDIIKMKCERGYDEANNRKYCDQILPGSWNKIARDLERANVNEAKARYDYWRDGGAARSPMTP